MFVFRTLSCNCLWMASFGLKIAEHKFKEARKASFRIFQLVFGVALPFPFSCDVHFCMAVFVCLKYEIVLKQICTRQFLTD